MTAGLEVYNIASGKISIDQDYKNLALTAKVTSSTDTFFATYSIKEITITGATSPVFAWACTTPGWMEKVDNPSSGTFVYRLRLNSASATSFTYYIFDVPPAGFVAKYIEVFDATGTPTFKGGMSYLNVVDFIGPIKGGSTTVGGVPDGGGAIIDTTYTAGRSYAVIQAAAAFYLQTIVSGNPPNQTSNFNWRANFANTITNGVRTQGLPVQTTSLPGSAAPSYSVPGFWIVVDVTFF